MAQPSKEILKKVRRLARQVRKFRKERGGEVRRGYPEAVEALAAEIAESGEMNCRQIHELTGLSPNAVKDWTVARRKKERKTARFKRLRVARESRTEGPGSSYPVEGPAGLVITQMRVEDIAVLWRCLAKLAA